MLREENEILQDRLRENGNGRENMELLEKISKLERKLNKANSDKTALENKVQLM